MPKCMYRLWTAVVSVCLLCAAFPMPGNAVSTSATAAVLMDADSGRILYARNENKRMLIASTTKILTALVAIENGDLTKVVTVKREATLAEGTSMYLKEGDCLSLEALLYGLLLSSGNDAALAVADAVAGSTAEFVSMMNRKAAELGMTDSSFANPNGLDAEGHYSTALDMARLACAAMENETLMRIASTVSASVGGRSMSNHNRLLQTIDGCTGLKTGYTRAAGRTLVSCVERDGRRLAAVTLQDGNDWEDHATLFDYGFSAFSRETVLRRGEIAECIPVIGGVAESVSVVAADTLAWTVGESEKLTIRCELPRVLAAPVKAGTVVGQAVLLLDGTEVARTKLLCAESVSAAIPAIPEKRSLFQRLRSGERSN